MRRAGARLRFFFALDGYAFGKIYVDKLCQKNVLSFIQNAVSMA